jgi:hypothetical protein
MSILKISRLTCISILLLLTQLSSNAQTLTPGTIVVIGWNCVTDVVRFATLANIPSGKVIKITDKGWNQATNAFNTVATGDGVITWTTSSMIPKGTVLSLFIGGTGDAQVTTLTNQTTGLSLTADISIAGFTVADPMLINGDGIFIYEGLDTNPFFIFGFNNSAGMLDGSNWNISIAITLRDSQIPNGTGSQNALTNGINAIGMPGGISQQDNVQYTGLINAATGGSWLVRFMNMSNWTGENTGASGSSIGSSIVVSFALPVSLLSFTAQIKDDDVLLQWKTADEINFSHFELESSLNGISFASFATVAPSGSTNDKQYNWLHSGVANLLSRKLYYRLKLVDNDGRFTYSRIIMVSTGSTTQRILNVSPNPFAGQFSIYLNLPGKGDLNIRLTDMNGAVVLQKKVTAEKGFSSLAIPAPDALAKGSYLLTVVYAEEIYQYKLLKR